MINNKLSKYDVCLFIFRLRISMKNKKSIVGRINIKIKKKTTINMGYRGGK